jgi:heat-inducible transcriptional repressor
MKTMSDTLDERSWEILSATVTGYIRMAAPVGSRAVNRLFGLSYSPATIRNVMADLEEIGYLTHPHTSAGRIPTPKGFRYFVDNTDFSKGSLPEGTPKLESLLEGVLSDTSPVDLLDVLSTVMNLVTRITNYTGIVMEAGVRNGERLLSFEVVPLTERSLLAVLITETGTVLKKVIMIPDGLGMAEVIARGEDLNTGFRSCTLVRIREMLMMEIEHLGRSYVEFFSQVLSVSRQPELKFIRTSSFTDLPEFSNAATLREIMVMFEEKAALFRIFKELVHEERGVSVRIGSENPLPALQPCTIVAIPIMNRNVWLGSIGLIGPVRMQYDQVIPLMVYLSRRLNQWVEETAPLLPLGP